MRHERSRLTLQGTALVHEAFLRLVKAQDVDWQDRAHFFALSAQIMRRSSSTPRGAVAEKRGGGRRGPTTPRPSISIRLPSADRCAPVALRAGRRARDLAQFDARRAKVIELRFFGGLSVEETAEVLAGVAADRDARLAVGPGLARARASGRGAVLNPILPLRRGRDRVACIESSN